MATRLLVAELAGAFERLSDCVVTLEAAGGVDAAKRVACGEAFDAVVLAADAIDQLIASGHVVAQSKVDLARSGVAVAIAVGAPAIDISSEDTVRQAVLRARSIGFSTGPSGVQLVRLFEHWGIADEVRARLVRAPPGVPVGTLVARGDVELGFQQLSELMHLEGIKLLGPLPPDIQIVTTFSGGVCVAAAQPELARAMLEFMASPSCAESKPRHGMEPA